MAAGVTPRDHIVPPSVQSKDLDGSISCRDPGRLPQTPKKKTGKVFATTTPKTSTPKSRTPKTETPAPYRRYGAVSIIPREINLEPGMEITARETLTFTPSTVTMPRAITRFAGNGWTSQALTDAANWPRNAPEHPDGPGVPRNSWVVSLREGARTVLKDSTWSYRNNEQNPLPSSTELRTAVWFTTLTKNRDDARLNNAHNDPYIIWLADGVLLSRFPTGDDARWLTRVIERLLSLSPDDPLCETPVSKVWTLAQDLRRRGVISKPPTIRAGHNPDAEAYKRWVANMISRPSIGEPTVETALCTVPEAIRRDGRAARDVDVSPVKGKKRNVKDIGKDTVSDGEDEIEEIGVGPPSPSKR
ncbi:hypothetical protein LTS18_014554, partial [Coniosporium uncinatum]